MSKNKIDIKENVMLKIKSGQIKMRPKIYFVVGSIALMLGFAGVIIFTIFMMNVTAFSLRTHGPMGEVRIERMWESFPWWAPALALAGLVFGILFLRKFEFSYKKNFLLIIIGFVISVLVAGWILDYTGLNDLWLKKGPMRRFYQQQNNGQMRGPGWRIINEKDGNSYRFNNR